MAASDDAWERDSCIIAMVHNLTATVGGMFGGKTQFQNPDHFNASLKPPAGSPEAIADDYPWAQPEPEKKEADTENNGHGNNSIGTAIASSQN